MLILASNIIIMYQMRGFPVKFPALVKRFFFLCKKIKLSISEDIFLDNRLSVSEEIFSIGASLILSSKQPDEAQHIGRRGWSNSKVGD